MDIDYRLAFELAPVGLCLSRDRRIVDCNALMCEMFGVPREALVGESFQFLYPSADEYERLGARIAPILNTRGRYADDRIMKRADGDQLAVAHDTVERRGSRGVDLVHGKDLLGWKESCSAKPERRARTILPTQIRSTP